MKIGTAVKASVLTATLGIACLLPARVQAQFEVAPDSYPLSNTVPIAAQPMQAAIAQDVKADYEAKFSLPYDLKCSGRNLKAGEYLLSVRSEGSNRLVTINGDGEKVNFPVREVKSNQGASQSGLMVRKLAEGHTLEAVYVEALKAMFYLQPKTAQGMIELLPLTGR